ncbi:hypothetical protein [uncultured Xanthomonas sp.]|uniref:hypothetical protein n=1 Tax=uncultured Xanthomonas sp. TaxID=152831 RepID=UPI0025DCAECF|nr:hypothetical protein [uncultured Xanthomonas sp.]
MSVNREWVGQVEQLLAEIAPRRGDGQPKALQDKAFAWYDLNVQLAPLEQSPRARAIREITRLATYHGWGQEVARFLDRNYAPSLPALADDALQALRDHMLRLEDCLHSGAGAPEAPPAW